MTRLIIPRAGQPQGVVRPNRAHFFGAECDYLWTPGNDGGKIPKVRTPNGLAGVPNASFTTGTSRNLGLRPWCTVLVMMFPSASQSGTLFNAGNSTGGARLIVGTGGSSIQLNWSASMVGSGTNQLVETGVTAFNKIAGVLVTNWTASGQTSWFKRPGKPVFTFSDTLAIVSPTDFSVNLGAAGTIGIELAAISSVILNATQARSLLENPWQIVEPLSRNSRVRAAAGGGSYTSGISEALPLADAASIVAALSGSISEAAALGHTQDAVVGRFSSVSEALALLDSASNVAAFGATATEPMSLASSAANVAALSASTSEAMTLADTRSAAAAGDYAASITEAAALADSQSNVAALSASLTEAATLDSTASATAAGDYIAAITESVALAASGSNVAALSSTIAESATLASSASNVAALSAAVSEAMSFASSHAGALPGTFTVGIAEAMALNDATTVQAALSAALVEAMSLADGTAAPWALYASIVEALALNDVLSASMGSSLRLFVDDISVLMPDVDHVATSISNDINILTASEGQVVTRQLADLYVQ